MWIILSDYNQIRLAIPLTCDSLILQITMTLSSAECASFATIARLLSCLVTESLVRAIFLPLQCSDCVGIGVVLNAPVSNMPATDCISYSEGDILAIMVLKHVPVFKHNSSDPRGREVGLLDPLDMSSLVLVTVTHKDSDENEEVLL
ncbi:hypothetical protein EDB89DRAFT_1558789 [Lactarius sanguifluus]|nr:hypothetical protein EDB89DRAFT_1558789 [Lactarius sanguifluus]